MVHRVGIVPMVNTHVINNSVAAAEIESAAQQAQAPTQGLDHEPYDFASLNRQRMIRDGIDPESPEGAAFQMQADRRAEISKLQTLRVDYAHHTVEQLLQREADLEMAIAMLTPPLPDQLFREAEAKAKASGKYGLKLVRLVKNGNPRDNGAADYLPTEEQVKKLNAAVKQHSDNVRSAAGTQALRQTLADNQEKLTFTKWKWDVDVNSEGEAVPVVDTRIDFGAEPDLSAYNAQFGDLMAAYGFTKKPEAEPVETE